MATEGDKLLQSHVYFNLSLNICIRLHSQANPTTNSKGHFQFLNMKGEADILLIHSAYAVVQGVKPVLSLCKEIPTTFLWKLKSVVHFSRVISGLHNSKPEIVQHTTLVRHYWRSATTLQKDSGQRIWSLGYISALLYLVATDLF